MYYGEINFEFKKEDAKIEFMKMGAHVFTCRRHLALKGLGQDIDKFLTRLKKLGFSWDDIRSWILEQDSKADLKIYIKQDAMVGASYEFFKKQDSGND